MEPSKSPTTKPLYRLTQLAWYLFGLIEALLLIRFILKLLGANPGAGFSRLIYGLTSPLLAPFFNVFRPDTVGNGIIEWTTLLALLVYWLVVQGIVKLFLIGRDVTTPEAAHRLKKEEK